MSEPTPEGWRPIVPLEAPAFGTTYDKARKSYGIATALLLAWALIGIDLQPDVLSNYKITLKSPQAAPYVLVAAVLYFAFRLTIEWHQTNPTRRAMLASRVDYWVAHGLAIVAVSLFTFQTLSRMQIANLPPAYLIGVVGAFIGGQFLGHAVRDLVELRFRRLSIYLSVVVVIALGLIGLAVHNKGFNVGLIVFVLVNLVIGYGIRHMSILHQNRFRSSGELRTRWGIWWVR